MHLHLKYNLLEGLGQLYSYSLLNNFSVGSPFLLSYMEKQNCTFIDIHRNSVSNQLITVKIKAKFICIKQNCRENSPVSEIKSMLLQYVIKYYSDQESISYALINATHTCFDSISSAQTIQKDKIKITMQYLRILGP